MNKTLQTCVICGRAVDTFGKRVCSACQAITTAHALNNPDAPVPALPDLSQVPVVHETDALTAGFIRVTLPFARREYHLLQSSAALLIQGRISICLVDESEGTSLWRK